MSETKAVYTTRDRRHERHVRILRDHLKGIRMRAGMLARQYPSDPDLRAIITHAELALARKE